MKRFEYTVTDAAGLHIRPAGALAREMKRYPDTVVTLTAGDRSARADALMKVMTLGVRQGDAVTVTVEGGDEEAVCAAMQRFFQENF